MAAKPGMPGADVMRELGRQWLEMGDDDKQPYLKMAAEARLR